MVLVLGLVPAGLIYLAAAAVMEGDRGEPEFDAAGCDTALIAKQAPAQVAKTCPIEEGTVVRREHMTHRRSPTSYGLLVTRDADPKKQLEITFADVWGSPFTHYQRLPAGTRVRLQSFHGRLVRVGYDVDGHRTYVLGTIDPTLHGSPWPLVFFAFWATLIWGVFLWVSLDDRRVPGGPNVSSSVAGSM